MQPGSVSAVEALSLIWPWPRPWKSGLWPGKTQISRDTSSPSDNSKQSDHQLVEGMLQVHCIVCMWSATFHLSLTPTPGIYSLSRVESGEKHGGVGAGKGDGACIRSTDPSGYYRPDDEVEEANIFESLPSNVASTHLGSTSAMVQGFS